MILIIEYLHGVVLLRKSLKINIIRNYKKVYLQTRKDKKMKILLTLTLIIIMLMTLVACGSDNTAQNEPTVTNTPAPTPEQNEPATTPDGGNEVPDSSVDNGNGNHANGDTGDGNPETGTPVNAPAPFEQHPGDNEFFYMLSDDYIIWKYIINDFNLGELVYSRVIFFSDDGKEIDTFQKRVFESSAVAEMFYDLHAWMGFFIERVENVVYDFPVNTYNPPQIASPTDKNTVIQFLAEHRPNADVYVSKP